MVNCCGPCGLGGGGDSGFTAVNRTFIFAPEVAHKGKFNALMDKVGSHVTELDCLAWIESFSLFRALTVRTIYYDNE